MTKEERQQKREAEAALKAEKQRLKEEAERERLRGMWNAQKELSGAARFVFGIDEAGRGPLCGPVVAACCILPEDAGILYLNDSKKLSGQKREALYEEIVRTALAYGIGMTGPERIDEINILQATYEAMRMAVQKLAVQPELLLVDAVHIPDMNIRQVSIVKGDARSQSIAAASIIAKVTRDHLMTAFSDCFPEYDLASNKGYGTAAHIKALKEYGPSPIHRQTFIRKFI